ncbi:hypothetical protein [Desulfopila aestuarii]|uniref:Helix-turn-helix domain-containing protein n=1 Tax=Desulfopila aestuarii DSM 18488 TaxID=1121416 RepID=A0A1M7YCP1_9BACT|nr:hypothetical protein [Desulfopila aestuarii]SHO50422.1 hypothetical protein SAMN02745220_03428 [Desulfopila aestuarii DSM 18488]
MVEKRAETDFEKFLEDLERALPPIFARHRLTELSGGLINSRTIANRMSLGNGPPGIMVGRKIGLSRESFINWLRDNSL